MPKYEVQTDTLCQGWINSWTVTDENGERPDTYDTEAEAQAEIDELIQDTNDEIASGCRDADSGFSQEGFRIVEVQTKVTYICPECSGKDICIEAACVWNVETQAWEPSTLFDDVHTCQFCANEVEAVEVKI